MAQAQAPQLALHVLNVGFGGGTRVCAGLYRVLFGGQAECVVAEGVENIVAQHAVVAGEHVGGDVPQRVADVQAGTGRVREHVLDEEFIGGNIGTVGGGEVSYRVGGFEGVAVVPFLLPTGFDLGGQFSAVAVDGADLDILRHDNASPGVGLQVKTLYGVGSRIGGAAEKLHINRHLSANLRCRNWLRQRRM